MTTFDEWLTELEGQLRGLVVEAGGRVETDAPHLKALVDRVRELEASLREIAKGEGRFSHDPREHAWNTIVDMKLLATTALGEEAKEMPDDED